MSFDSKGNLKRLSSGYIFVAVTCSVVMTQYLDKSNSGKQGCVVALSLRVHSITAGKLIMAEVAGHPASTVRKQREMSTQLALSLLFSLKPVAS